MKPPIIEDKDKQSAKPLIIIGLILGGFPLLCGWFMVISTGHSIKPGWEEIFYSLVYLGFSSGCIFVPLGLISLIIGLVRQGSKPKPRQ